MLNRRLLEQDTAPFCTRPSARETEETIIIPVVVHIVHDNTSGRIGGNNNPNISEEQVFSQLDVLNEDYRRKKGTDGFNTDLVGADVNIEFRLANRDPRGNYTSGITRTYTKKTGFDITLEDRATLAELVNRPTDQFLNTWAG